MLRGQAHCLIVEQCPRRDRGVRVVGEHPVHARLEEGDALGETVAACGAARAPTPRPLATWGVVSLSLAAGVVGAATLGSFAGHLLFGNNFALDNRDLALLALGSALFILALTLAQALIALNGHSRATFAWLVGNAWFWAATAMSSDDLFLRNEIGFAVGAGMSAAVMAWLLQRRFREEVPAGALDELVENDPRLGPDALPLLEPGSAVRRRTTPGGGGPEPVARQLEAATVRLEEQRLWLER